MATINSYLNFSGNTEEVFGFYKSVFGGEYAMVMRYKDAPQEHQMGESDGEKIMHMALPIGEHTILMGSDWPEAYGKPIEGSNISLSISADSREEADNLFNALAEGGQVTMPMENTFWGSYFGMLKDKFGFNWMMSFDSNQP
ncbi:MAG TPA: VOC family protein [Flavisolibacter sp.]|jgi:PhnB protein|nr:VOC family protein [Flavisolibacter sp.]